MSASAILPELPKGGFVFDNHSRNEMLVSNGFTMKKARKTGTTICGIIFEDGVILGADTRATEGSLIADKNCSKIHFMAPNIYCCGAGTAADCEYVTRMLASQLELHSLSTGKQAPVVAANRMLVQYLFRYQGHVGADLVLGGVDIFGPHLFSIHPHGSCDNLPFVTMGSGSLAAMSVFESRWKPNMKLDEGKQLVRDAIAAGVFNDLGSGSNVDICVITKSGVDYIRPYDRANVKGVRQNRYTFKDGATSVLTSKQVPLIVEEVMVRQVDQSTDSSVEQMDTA